jgi:hypothetical protein
MSGLVIGMAGWLPWRTANWRRRSGKVARHIVVGMAWGRVESRVERHPDTWPVPAQRAFGWALGYGVDERRWSPCLMWQASCLWKVR